ncbi:MAG TPA: hypothetical protein VLZ50_12820 [Terracidiphilus sp.]|nr:hypothetical protein [Terracidiphilus sp.]
MAVERIRRIETEDEVACETFLHHRLRSKQVVNGGGTEFFRVDPDELSLALRDAEEFVSKYLTAKKQAEELGKEEPDSNVSAVAPSPTDLEVYARLLKVREEQRPAQGATRVFRVEAEAKDWSRVLPRRRRYVEGAMAARLRRSGFSISRSELNADLYRRFGSDTYTRSFRIQRFD